MKTLSITLVSKTKIFLALVLFATASSISSANALQLKCQSEVSVSCLAKECYHEKDETYDTVTILVNVDKKLIIRTATSESLGERTSFCDIAWDYRRTGAYSNLSYDAFYICSEDPKFPKTGIIDVLEYWPDAKILFNDSHSDAGITTSTGICKIK